MAGNDKDLKIGITADTSGAEAAKAALEGVKQAAEGAAQASKTVDSSVNPMTDGSQLRARAQPAEEVAKTTQAIEEQVEALEDLTDAEAGVIRSTAKLNEEAGKEDGFAMLFKQQRMIEWGRQLVQLGVIVGDFAREFAKTEKGQEILAGLDDKTKAYGSTALGVASSVASGFAVGGPIGGALGGITALVQKFASEYLDAQARIEASNAEFEQAQARAVEAMEAKRKAAADKEVARTLAAEKALLDDQNASLATQNELWDARTAAARSALDLEKARAELAGEDTNGIERKRLAEEARQAMIDLKRERDAALKEDYEAQRARDVAAQAAQAVAATRGTDSREYAEARRNFDQADAARRRSGENLPGRLEAIGQREDALRSGSAAARTRLEDDRLDRELEARRRQQAEARQREGEIARRQRAEEQAEARVDRGRDAAGREGESIADSAARAIAKTSERAAKNFEKLGDDLAGNPTVAAADALGKSLDRVAQSVEGQNASLARQLRQMADRMARVEAKIRQGGDGK